MYVSVMRDDPPAHLRFVLSTLLAFARERDVGRLAAHRLGRHSDGSFLRFVKGEGWHAVMVRAMELHLIEVLAMSPVPVPNARALFGSPWRELRGCTSFLRYIDSGLRCLYYLAVSVPARVEEWESYVELSDFEFVGHPYAMMAILRLEEWCNRFRPLVRDWRGVLQTLIGYGNSSPIPDVVSLVSRFVPDDAPLVVGVGLGDAPRFALIERNG
jgi:hypothetical protein